MKTNPITAIIGVGVGIALVYYFNTNPAAFTNAREALTARQPVAQAAPAPVATPEVPQAPPTTHLPAVQPKKGMTAKDIGITNRGNLMMPDDCQDPEKTGMQNMVTYVTMHPGIPDADIPDYVCGWN
jgi:hypothetical protein